MSVSQLPFSWVKILMFFYGRRLMSRRKGEVVKNGRK